MAFSFSNLFSNIFRPKQSQPAPQSYAPAPMSYAPVKETLNYTPANFTPDPNAYKTTLPPAQEKAFFQQYSSPTPSPAPTPAPSAGSGGRVLGATDINTGAQTDGGGLSAQEQSLLNQARSEGRFEGLPDRERAAQMAAYLGQKGTIQQEVDNEYQGVFNILDQIQNNIQNSQGDLISGAAAPFDAQKPLLEQARSEGLASNATQVGAEKQREANVLAEARALANELRQANVQRFGGASSAGQFADQLQGRELQRSTTSIRNTTTQNLAKLSDQATAIQSGYENNLRSLEYQKQAAISNAQDVYRQRLAAIDNSRLEATQNKAAAKLDALRELRQNAQSIEATYAQNKQQIQANAQAQADQLKNAIIAYQVESGQPIDLSALPGAQYSTFEGGAQASPGSDLLPTGQVRREDQQNPLITGQVRRPDQLVAA